MEFFRYAVSKRSFFSPYRKFFSLHVQYGTQIKQPREGLHYCHLLYHQAVRCKRRTKRSFYIFSCTSLITSAAHCYVGVFKVQIIIIHSTLLFWVNVFIEHIGNRFQKTNSFSNNLIFCMYCGHATLVFSSIVKPIACGLSHGYLHCRTFCRASQKGKHLCGWLYRRKNLFISNLLMNIMLFNDKKNQVSQSHWFGLLLNVHPIPVAFLLYGV